jgi:predicted nucleic acid-binding protein
MKKIFLDANVIIDYLDKSSQNHKDAVCCIRIIRKHFGKPVISPVTFIIVNYILGKFVKNKQWHKDQMELIVSGFEVTGLQSSFIKASFTTYFTDLEDALQYLCAASVKAKLIITRDLNDYFDSKIPVVHPQDFVRRYERLK